MLKVYQSTQPISQILPWSKCLSAVLFSHVKANVFYPMKRKSGFWFAWKRQRKKESRKQFFLWKKSSLFKVNRICFIFMIFDMLIAAKITQSFPRIRQIEVSPWLSSIYQCRNSLTLVVYDSNSIWRTNSIVVPEKKQQTFNVREAIFAVKSSGF